ncbi:hypothetical protein Adt_00770 [Abeliophyllum distichum]|uniref:Uncharacterized protein n=1 Tax=Abeliophyllum distichum TaxID=126358 RepID=A0ABD1VR15_9LAMI
MNLVPFPNPHFPISLLPYLSKPVSLGASSQISGDYPAAFRQRFKSPATTQLISGDYQSDPAKNTHFRFQISPRYVEIREWRRLGMSPFSAAGPECHFISLLG